MLRLPLLGACVNSRGSSTKEKAKNKPLASFKENKRTALIYNSGAVLFSNPGRWWETYFKSLPTWGLDFPFPSFRLISPISCNQVHCVDVQQLFWPCAMCCIWYVVCIIKLIGCIKKIKYVTLHKIYLHNAYIYIELLWHKIPGSLLSKYGSFKQMPNTSNVDPWRRKFCAWQSLWEAAKISGESSFYSRFEGKMVIWSLSSFSFQRYDAHFISGVIQGRWLHPWSLTCSTAGNPKKKSQCLPSPPWLSGAFAFKVFNGKVPMSFSLALFYLIRPRNLSP